MDRPSGKGGFFSKRLWELDPAETGGIKRRSISLLQFMSFTSSKFIADDALLRATALSFTTLLSIVPLLALAFSVLKGLGAQNKLAPLILNQVAAGSEVVVNQIISYIGNTNMTSVGVIGLVALIYTAINMLGSIEEAFNVVWHVAETRSLYRKFSDYLSILISAPLLLLAATSVTTTLQSESLVNWLLERTYFGGLFLFSLQLIPYLSIWSALFLLYIFLPNTRVRYRSALIGAVLAGTLWQIAQWGYIHFQVGAANYNAIYGTLAALPIMMIWIFLSWIIVLFGMEVVAAHQNLATFRRNIRGRDISQSFKELVALAALRHIAEAFHTGEPGWSDERLAIRLSIPLHIMRHTLARLEAAHYLVHSAEQGTYYPAQELDQIELARVLLSLRSEGAACHIVGEEQARDILDTVDQAVSAALGGLSLKDLAEGEKIPRSVDKEGAVGL